MAFTLCIFRKHRKVLIVIGAVILVNLILLLYPKSPGPPGAAVEVDVVEFVRVSRAVTLSAAQRARTLALVARVGRLLRQHRVPFFLCCGSAIGAARHRDLVPFDDDFDVYVSDSDRTRLALQLNASSGPLAEAGLAMSVHPRFSKLFFRRPDPHTDVEFRQYPYRWPWVDLMPFHDNGTHIRGKDDPDFPQDFFVFKKVEVFPLGEAEVGGLRLPVMRCWRSVLLRAFPAMMDRCCTGDWNHRKEDFLLPDRSRVCVPCRRLWGRFPFVVRLNASAEALLRGGRVVRVLRNEEPAECRALR